MGDMQSVGKNVKHNKPLQYVYNLVVSGSDLVYTALGGSPRVTLSQAMGFRQLVKKETWWSKPLRLSIDLLFRTALSEKNHCLESVTGETNVRGMYDIDKELALHIAERTSSAIRASDKGV